jgi:uncharacterized protein
LKNTDNNPEQKIDTKACATRLEQYFSTHAYAIVAYSGGVDSALLAYTAHLVLKDRMLAALADSPSLSRREYRLAVDFAQEHAIPLQIIRTQEMDDPDYRVNPSNRCYYCKKELFRKISKIRSHLESSAGNPSWPIFYGANLDDLGDFRPGQQAAKEAAILSPYTDLGYDKDTIRTICKYYGLAVAEKPAMPCLSSRIQYGEPISIEKLNQVEFAEDFLYDLGFRVLRVRHHGDTARIEIPAQDFEALLSYKERISQKFHDLGFVYIALDIDGFKSGSLNAVLNLS